MMSFLALETEMKAAKRSEGINYAGRQQLQQDPGAKIFRSIYLTK
jgi:hypothetical protein